MDSQVRVELVNQLRTLLDDDSSNDDPTLAKALSFFSGSLTSLLSTLATCEAPKNKTEAACNILQRLFFVCEEKQAAEKRDPLQFDDTSMLIRSCESLVSYFQKTCDDINSAISGAARSTSIVLPPQQQQKQEFVSTSLLEDILKTRERLERLRLDVGHFCSQVSQQFRVRVVFAVEIEKTLHFWTENWKLYSQNEQQQIAKCVATLVETRLERQWFSEFLDHATYIAQSSTPSSSDALLAGLESFRLNWVKDWGKRCEVSQDNALLVADNLKQQAVRAAGEFPSSLRPSAFALNLLSKVQTYSVIDRPKTSALVKNKPREALRRADRFAKENLTKLHDSSVLQTVSSK
jgi:hypothetical protein